MQEILNALTPQEMNMLAVALLVLGFLYCFCGYRLAKFLIGLSGFVLSGVTAVVLAHSFFVGNLWAMGIAGLIGGIAGVCAILFLYKVAVFILGFTGAAVMAQGILSAYPVDWAPWAILGSAFVGGFLALVLERFALTVATAVLGALFLVAGSIHFLGVLDILDDPERLLADLPGSMVGLSCWGVLSLAGVFSQYATRKRSVPEKESSEKAS